MFYRLEKKTSKNLTYIQRNTAVSPTGFHDRDGQQYCQQCFLTLFASRCQGCSQPILENYISALNSLWHPQCFVCRVSVSLDISVIASAASGKRADKEQKKKRGSSPLCARSKFCSGLTGQPRLENLKKYPKELLKEKAM